MASWLLENSLELIYWYILWNVFYFTQKSIEDYLRKKLNKDDEDG